MFFTVLLLAFSFLASWLPRSKENRKLVRLVVGLVIVGFIASEAGRILLGWEPPWEVRGVEVPPPSTFDIIALPSIAFLGIIGWFGLSTAGMKVLFPRFKFNLWRALLFTAACLVYFLGMIWFRWPAPWNLPIPSE